MTFAGEFLGLPGLRGYWPMSAFDSSGNAIDQSGNARTLTYNGGGTGPTYNYTTQGGPYCDLDGTGDYFSRADEAGLDILGTEAYVATAQRGLTMGGWFWADVLGATNSLMGKYDAGTQLSYLLRFDSTSPIFYISNTGSDAAFVSVTGTTVATGAWKFVVARFTPSTEIAIWVNGSKTPNTSSIFASLFNSTAPFRIGSSNSAGGQLLDGRAGPCFACAMILTDTAIDNIYNNTKSYYGL